MSQITLDGSGAGRLDRLPDPPSSPLRRAASYLARRGKVALGLLLSAPLLWLGIVYIVALALLLVTALWQVDGMTGRIRTTWTLDNITTVLTGAVYHAVTLRTLGIALAVTAIDVLIALPVGFYMAKVAGPRTRGMLAIAFLMPLWASYLVKAYSWRAIVSEGGVLAWLGQPLGLGAPGFDVPATIMTLAYIWLPYVIMPVYATFERVPASLMEASADLGARSGRTFASVVLPMVVPGVIAGAIFSFSLSLGDYIAVSIVGGSNQTLGTLIYSNVGTANNLPLAAAIALIPIAIILVFLLAVRRTGALKNL